MCYWSAAFSLIMRSRKVSFDVVLYWYTIKDSIIEIISSENLSPYSRHIYSHVMKMFFNRIFIEFRFHTLVDLLFTPIVEIKTKKLNFGFCWKLGPIWIPPWNEIINENCASISLESFIDTFWKIKEIWNNYIRKNSNNDSLSICCAVVSYSMSSCSLISRLKVSFQKQCFFFLWNISLSSTYISAWKAIGEI